MRLKGILFLTAVALTAATAFAGSGWHKVATLQAGGDAQEVTVRRACSTCLIKVSEGSVVINTLVVREGDKKDPIKVGARIDAGDHREVGLGDKRNVEGLRISAQGDGRFEVYVK
jgi:positive regulator of sigma E activity